MLENRLTYFKTKILDEKIPYFVRKGNSTKNIIFLHGLNDDRMFWEKVVSKISNEFNCWSLSLPKYKINIFKKYSEIVKIFIEKNKIKNFCFVGHSLGGLIFLKLISENVIPEKMILVSVPIFSKAPKITIRFIDSCKNMLKRPIIKNVSVFLIRRIKWGADLLEKAPIESYFQCYSDIINREFSLNFEDLNIEIPFTIVHGKYDFFLDICNGKSLYQEMKPKHIFELNSSHFIPITHPKELADIINNF